jgi:GNAT superfamily N-acetyltransferase
VNVYLDPRHAQSLVDQHRAARIADARAHRLAALARLASSAPPDDAALRPIVVPSLHVRPIEVFDGERLTRLFARLSPRSVYQRFFAPIHRLTPDQVRRFVEVDHRCREALVALDDDEIVAVARYDSDCGARDAEVAVTVEDAWQRRGVGRVLTRRLALLATARGFDGFTANILGENRAALALVRDLAPSASLRWDDGAYRVSIPFAPR